MRASICNGLPEEGVDALLNFMEAFENNTLMSKEDELSKVRKVIDSIDDRFFLCNERLS